MKKRPLDRTKVVWRHLPPSITQAYLTEQIDSVFAGLYDWVSLRPGKCSQKRHALSRAYIKFKRPEDVAEFAGFFDGHVFVNEKGSRFKTIVEYAPFQRFPVQRLRKDHRDGTLITDPEYIEFLKLLVTPVWNLPNSDMLLGRREAEESGVAEGVPIVTTPLMDYVRRKRASKRSRTRGKLKEKAGKSSAETKPSLSSKLNTGKRRTSTALCVLTDTAGKSRSSIEKVTCNLVAKVEKLQLSNKSNTMEPMSQAELFGGHSGVSGFDNSGSKKTCLSERKVFGGIAPASSTLPPPKKKRKRRRKTKHKTKKQSEKHEGPSAEKHDQRIEKCSHCKSRWACG